MYMIILKQTKPMQRLCEKSAYKNRLCEEYIQIIHLCEIMIYKIFGFVIDLRKLLRINTQQNQLEMSNICLCDRFTQIFVRHLPTMT